MGGWVRRRRRRRKRRRRRRRRRREEVVVVEEDGGRLCQAHDGIEERGREREEGEEGGV